MSHDRGCPCGKEFYDCVDENCRLRSRKLKPMNIFGTDDASKLMNIKGFNEHCMTKSDFVGVSPDPIELTSELRKKQYDALVFIGRFSPFHKGHETVIKQALFKAEKVVVVVGSSFAARSLRNPFTFDERKAMIKSVFPTDSVLVVPVSDYPYDDNKWVNAIQKIVDKTVPDAKTIGLIGHNKDSTSYYLNIFPKWKNHVEVKNYMGLNSTDIRKILLDTNEHLSSESYLNATHISVQNIITTIMRTSYWITLEQEYTMIQKYKEAWKSAPFPPTFMTVDTVVVQSGHVLLVKRGDMPGKGLWALPGGFLNQDETMLDGAIRELKEETKIKIPIPVLKGSIKESKTFDAPNRSSRGRTITQAFYIDLGVGELSKVKGGDDAEKAFWIPFNKLKQELFFEDHHAILDYFLNINE